MSVRIAAPPKVVKTYLALPTPAVFFATNARFTANMEAPRIPSTARIQTASDIPAKVSHDRRTLMSIFDEYTQIPMAQHRLLTRPVHPTTTTANDRG